MSETRPPIHGEILEEGEWLTLHELTIVCRAHRELIVALIDEGVIEPYGREPEQWQFPPESVRRARAALRLQVDLGVNPAGAALILEMREELERLRARLGLPRGGW